MAFQTFYLGYGLRYIHQGQLDRLRALSSFQNPLIGGSFPYDMKTLLNYTYGK